jgi:hypothetical protein
MALASGLSSSHHSLCPGASPSVPSEPATLCDQIAMTASASAGEANHGPHYHPYFPPAVVIPHYIPSTTPLLEILAPFAGLAALAIIPAVVFARRHTSRAIDQFAAGWFALCKIRSDLLLSCSHAPLWPKPFPIPSSRSAILAHTCLFQS